MAEDRPQGGPPRGPTGTTLQFDEAQRAMRLAFNEIAPDDERRLAAMKPRCEGHLDEIVADFYAHLLRFPDLEALLRAEPGRVARLQGMQLGYFRRLLGGDFGEDYFTSRLRVGDAHQQLGVEPQWYIGAFGLFLRLCLRRLDEETPDRARFVDDFESLLKVVFLDMSLAMDTYIWGGFVDRRTAQKMREAREIAEEALRERREIERMKDDLASMVVHDLKNPVNGISMMVELALRKGHDLPEAHRGYLQQIDRTCREMLRLIQNLLEVSRIEDGKMPVERESVALPELAREVLREYRPVAEQAGRSLRADLDESLPMVIADRALAKRVLVNLVANALRHSGSPEVGIRARVGEGEGGGREVHLEVVDRGRGIRPEDAARVFEKFRSRPSASEAPGDTGLGLPFCKLAVEVMGGRIALESLAGGETVFRVSLPVA